MNRLPIKLTLSLYEMSVDFRWVVQMEGNGSIDLRASEQREVFLNCFR